VKTIQSSEFDAYWKSQSVQEADLQAEAAVREVVEAIKKEGDKAVRHFASRFDKSSPEQLEVPMAEVERAYAQLQAKEPALARALELAAEHIARFSLKQKEQFAHFEFEMGKGVWTGQRVIPVERAMVYAPGGRFPLISSLLMALLPALSAGVEEVFLASPPMEDGLPDWRILAAAAIAAKLAGVPAGRLRFFAVGGAQAVAAFALGTQSIPRADVIAGPGNKYVATAKRLLYGQVGIDFIAGPSDILVVADGSAPAELAAVDMIAQAEHDPDARARALVPNPKFADEIAAAIEKRLETLPTAATARASLENGGLIVVYSNKEEAIRIANALAPEHLELQTADDEAWVPHLKNYGSLFIGALAAEVLGDYSAGINHTLPTSTSARFTGGLSVRHFLKTVTTLRCAPGKAFEKVRHAAETLAHAEGLAGHALSAQLRENFSIPPPTPGGFMEILVRAPTEDEAAHMKSKPIWTCEVSEFDWHYDSEEVCLILEGEVTVRHGATSVRIAAGDYVVFPAGLSCVWNVTKPIKKHYIFR